MYASFTKNADLGDKSRLFTRKSPFFRVFLKKTGKGCSTGTLFSILCPVNFAKTTIHFQNSSQSVTFHVPAVFFRGLPVLKFLLVVGFLLFLVQFTATTVYHGLLDHVLNDRAELDKDLSQIQETLDYLNRTSSDFLGDEQKLHSKYGLPLPDEEERSLGTGGSLEPKSKLLMETSPVFEKMADLKDQANRLHGKLENNSNAFNSLTDYIKQKQSAWRFMPSISPTQGRYASSFGPRIHPVTGEVGKMHYGVDIANDRWTPIFAAADGVVDVAQMSTTFGNYVTLNHGNGIVTRYGHMQMYLVHPGQFVHRYQIIGYMGNTGRSVGPHLHYEVWINNVAVNPLAYMLPGDYAVD